MIKYTLIVLLLANGLHTYAQNNSDKKVGRRGQALAVIKSRRQNELHEGCTLLCSKSEMNTVRMKNNVLLQKLENIIRANDSFKEAVFLSEQGYKDKVSPGNYYNDYIRRYTKLIQKYSHTVTLVGYKQCDSLNYLLNLSLYTAMCKSISIKSDSLVATTSPFIYNFDDPRGDKDFSSTFVTKLLTMHYGNCKSLCYLYKILAEELGAKCWLALAPNHIYIRNYSKQIGWYNTELTSGAFPTDAWIAATGYVNAEAIRNGAYMDTLSNQQSIGLTILDLAQGYIRQTCNYTDGFVLRCCNLVLKYHPINVMALLLKAETLQKIYLTQKKDRSIQASNTYREMEEVYTALAKSGYREMPFLVYQQWLKAIKDEKDRFDNPPVK